MRLDVVALLGGKSLYDGYWKLDLAGRSKVVEL